MVLFTGSKLYPKKKFTQIDGMVSADKDKASKRRSFCPPGFKAYSPMKKVATQIVVSYNSLKPTKNSDHFSVVKSVGTYVDISMFLLV